MVEDGFQLAYVPTPSARQAFYSPKSVSRKDLNGLGCKTCVLGGPRPASVVPGSSSTAYSNPSWPLHFERRSIPFPLRPALVKRPGGPRRSSCACSQSASFPARQPRHPGRGSSPLPNARRSIHSSILSLSCPLVLLIALEGIRSDVPRFCASTPSLHRGIKRRRVCGERRRSQRRDIILEAPASEVGRPGRCIRAWS